MPWKTLLVNEAVQEIGSLEGREREAVENAVKKLQALGPQLGYPHSSAVRGAQDLRELRPRAGRSPWRAFYRCISEAFVIGAIGPEAAVNRRGFDRGSDGRRGATRRGGGGLMAKLSDLKSIDEVIEKHREADPQFRERWDRASFARAVAATIIRYRTEHSLTQTQLAREVGTTQSVIGRLELGEHPPSLATLAKLTARTRLEFHLDITGGDVAMSA